MGSLANEPPFHNQLGQRSNRGGGGQHGFAKLAAGVHQHAGERFRPFQRSAVGQLSRPIPPLALTLSRPGCDWRGAPRTFHRDKTRLPPCSRRFNQNSLEWGGPSPRSNSKAFGDEPSPPRIFFEARIVDRSPKTQVSGRAAVADKGQSQFKIVLVSWVLNKVSGPPSSFITPPSSFFFCISRASSRPP